MLGRHYRDSYGGTTPLFFSRVRVCTQHNHHQHHRQTYYEYKNHDFLQQQQQITNKKNIVK